MRHSRPTCLAVVVMIVAAWTARAAEVCVLQGPLKVATVPAFGPKRTVWREIPKGAHVDVKKREKDAVYVEQIGGERIHGTLTAGSLDAVCAPPIEPLTAPPTTSTTPEVPPPAPPILHFATRPRVLILGAKGNNSAVDNALTAEVARDSSMEVIDPVDARAVIDVATLAKAQECDDEPCVERAAGLFGAHKVIVSIVDGNAVRLVLFDVVHQSTVNRAAATGDVVDAARLATEALFGVTGHIRLGTQPQNAEVFLDGKRLGQTPVGELLLRKNGMHLIEVRGPGILPWKQAVEAKGGDDIDIAVRAAFIGPLQDEEALWRALAGTIAGAGVVAGGASALLYATAMQSDARLDGLDLRLASQKDLDAITGETFRDFLGSMALVGVSASLVAGGAALWFLNPATAAISE